ncbi:centrosomin isoform X6 [Anopheles arabiensis]|uniref:centrosomin isoform X6 n=1 Tax=Anopheles arabiensis TaxID=7173 RepID=UPI001AAC5AF0|nr:centrosomin isoform X6 [Anopheles arabiensis]
MSTGAPKLSTSLDESQLSQVKECLASFAEQTSPGVHQDATMDNSYAMGFRSPSINALTGHGSPVQVRSLRDNEEEISTLRKENFNLKLRIYFLEQKAGICTDNDTPGGLGVTSSSASNTSCDGNYLKQNIDLKVEVESLRQDLQSKHDLLCQAVKAMEVLEESHKKAEERHRELVNDLNHRIENHQAEIRSLELMAGELQKQHRELQLSTSLRGDPELQQQQQHAAEEAKEGMTTRDNVGESLLDFLDAVQQHSELSVQEKLKVLEMENAVRQCQERNEQLTRQVEQLQATIEEKASKISQLEMELGELRFENAELREESEKPQSNVEIDRLKKQNFDIRAELAEKLCVLDDTETKLKEKTLECTKTCKMVEKLIKTITEQDKELEKLKRNSNISLHSEHGMNGGATGALAGVAALAVNEIVDQDRKPVSQAEYDALVQRAKLLQQKNDTLIHKLCGNGGAGDHRNDRNIIIKQLNDELIKAREEAEKAQKWRKEYADLCAISTHRLEELAGFLDSLLRNKELIGSLSTDSRKAIRNAVDRSLDLSRSLNMSISVTGLSLIGTNNNSLAQLSCLSGYLDQSAVLEHGEHSSAGDDVDDEHDKENRASNVKGQTIQTGGHVALFGGLNQTKQMIETLRAENKALRGELMEQQQLQQQQHQQRTRRRESKERKSVPIEPISDSEAWSEPDRGVSLARIGLEDSSSALLRQKNGPAGGPTASLSSPTSGTAALELSSTSDNEPGLLAAVGLTSQRKSATVAEMKQLQETVASLSKELQDKNGTLLTVQSQLVDLDSELQRERIRAAKAQTEATETRQLSERWERDAAVHREQAEQAAQRLAALEGDIRQRDALIEKLRKEREQAAVDLRVAMMKLETMQSEYGELQQRHRRELDAMLAKEQQQLEELRQSLTESFRNELQLKQQSFDTALAQNYISKNIHQEKVRELDELHYRLEDAHNDLSAMAEAEEQLRRQLADCERSAAAMKKSLDEATLQASKAAIERTKALNEKRQLETELGFAHDELEQLKVEKNALNEQLQTIIRTQQQQHPRSPRGSGGGGNQSASGTDEEITPGVRRQLENSSPDLGIESDPGRLSNVELKFATSPQQRPLLKTLELTKSMSNLLLNPNQEVKPESSGESSKGAAGGEQQEGVGGGGADKTTVIHHDCAKIEVDYRDLMHRYNKTRHYLAVAYDKIKSSNKVKKQLEIEVKQQIHKTNVVLKTVQRNLDSGNDGAGEH